MASIVIAGDTSGSVTISAPAIAGTPTLTLPTTSGTLVVTGGAQTVQFAAGSAAAPSITFTGDTNTGIFSPAADTIAFTEGGAESMRIDSSGNVGIGVTPSAWAASSQAIQNVSGCIWRFGATNMYIGANYYYNGSNRLYVVNGAASEYNQNGTTHNFYSSTSGTAGGTVSMTQVLQVGLGTTVSLQGASTNISGTGISFPATQSASSDANTLDDYEEGTFSPTWISAAGSNPTVSYNTREGVYRKIGSFVWVTVRIDLSAFSGGTGTPVIGGLPFTIAADNSYPAACLGYKGGWSTSGPDYGRFSSGNTYIECYIDNNTGETPITMSNIGASTVIIMSGCYRVA